MTGSSWQRLDAQIPQSLKWALEDHVKKTNRTRKRGNIAIRPGELVRLKEKHIDTGNGYLIIPDPKEKKPKLVPLLDEDIALIKSIPKGFPELPFFRHLKGLQSIKENQPFGEKYFYKWWVRACEALGIEGVDMYGGTRHSSAIALRKYRTPEEIKRATMHSTNKAFERYFRMESDDLRDIYSDTTKSRGEVIKLRKRNGKK